MTKQTKSLIGGTMILSFSSLIVKLINILYKLPLTNMVGVKTMGYFNTIYPTYLVLTAASLVGIPATISKLVAEEREAGKPEAAHRIFQTGLACSSLIGLGVGLIFLFLPAYAEIFAWEGEIRYVLWGLALAPLLIAISGAIRGYFQGMQNMVPTAISQVIENLFKVILGVGLVWLMMKRNLADYISISGATIGISLGYILASAYLIWQYYQLKASFFEEGGQAKKVDRKIRPRLRSKGGKKGQADHRPSYMGKILWAAIPITLSSAMISIMGFIDSTMIYHSFAGIGISQPVARAELSAVNTVQTVINVPLAISAALAISILPAIAVAGVHQDQKEINDKINTGLQLASKTALPAVMGILLLARPILDLLYKDKINPQLLQIYSICMLFMILAQSVTSILQGLSGYYQTLVAVGVGVIFKIGANSLFIRAGWGGLGLIGASVVYFQIILAINFFFLRRQVKLSLDWARIIWRPLVASTIMGGLSWLIYQGLYYYLHHNGVAVLVAVGGGMVVYAIVMVAIKGFSPEEILILPRGQKVLAYMQKKKWLQDS